MKIGVPKEIISQEYRVAINPETAKLLIESSHQLFIQKMLEMVAAIPIKITKVLVVL